MRQRELKTVNRKLADHARLLSQQMIAKRDEVESIQTQSETLRDEFTQTRNDLARAHTAAELAESRLWSSLQSVRDGFALFDADDRLIVANKAYLSVFDGLECVREGITYAEIVQILVEEGIVDPQGPADEWIQAMTERWQNDVIEPLVVRLWNGQFIKMMDRRTKDGGTVTLGVNQTDQLRTWAAVETIPDGFVLYDADDRMVMCNARFREIYHESAEILVPGVTFEEILRFGMSKQRYPDAIGREEEWLEQRMIAHRDATRTVEQQMSDGAWLRMVDRLTIDGGRVGLRIDITAIKNHEAALVVERERAEMANRAKSAFLANMSHEIRTPMNGVVGMADLLAESGLSPEQELFVSTIRSSSEALLGIINNILDFSKMEAGKLILTDAAFDLEDCVHDVVRLLRPSIAGRPIVLDVAFDPAQPAGLSGDAGRLRQILTNLVGNALKFTENGRVDVRVGPTDDGQVKIEVADTGIGIPVDKLDHIFGEFTQVEDDRNRRFDGTGLGLAICRQLAGQMGGTITVDSQVDQGSRFTVILPLAVTDQDVSTVLATDRITRAVILVRDGANCSVLAGQLAQLGLPCALSADGPVGILPSDAVFVISEDADAAMPDFKGEMPAATILVTDKPMLAASKEAGFDRYLSLPVSRGVLARTLNGLSKPERPSTSEKTVRLRVLAAEDNRTNQLVLRKMLTDAHIDLQMTQNGAEAVESFRKSRPDMVFMDISMPVMDGKEAARRIREIEGNGPRIPIIAMTAHAMDSDRAEIAAAGIDHHMSKPLSRATLLAHIETVRAARQSDG